METNFPHDLAIKPSVDTRGLYNEYFIKVQESAIQSSGIAGKLWCEHRRILSIIQKGMNTDKKIG